MKRKQLALSPGEAPILCPAIRSLVREGKLEHQELKIAAVQELVHVLSGQPRTLPPNEPGSLANVAGYFAIFNHSLPHHEPKPRGLRNRIRSWFRKPLETTDAAQVAAGGRTDRKFSLHMLGSRGEHPGTVNFFHKKTGEFQPEQFRTVMNEVSDGETLTIDGIARMIVRANDGEWDVPGTSLDLAKSAGEWALLVCVLRKDPSSTDMPIAEIEQLYRDADSTRLLAGSRSATAEEWVRVTAQIAAAIARLRNRKVRLHKVFRHINGPNGVRLCPCITCNPAMWGRA